MRMAKESLPNWRSGRLALRRCTLMTFFFTTSYGGSRKETGLDLVNAGAAWREAARATADWFKEDSGQFQPGQHWELEVSDEQKKPLYLFRVVAERM